MADLYDRIEELAKEKGFRNMTQLCAHAGVPRATMTELKKGRSQGLSMTNAQKLATALGISLDAVYGQGDPRRVSDEDIKFALFGGDGPITDEMYEEVRRFAAYVKEREQKKE